MIAARRFQHGASAATSICAGRKSDRPNRPGYNPFRYISSQLLPLMDASGARRFPGVPGIDPRPEERVVLGLRVELLDPEIDGFAARITMNTEAAGTIITLCLDPQELDALEKRPRS
jgi:hypothetical protein